MAGAEHGGGIGREQVAVFIVPLIAVVGLCRLHLCCFAAANGGRSLDDRSRGWQYGQAHICRKATDRNANGYRPALQPLNRNLLCVLTGQEECCFFIADAPDGIGVFEGGDGEVGRLFGADFGRPADAKGLDGLGADLDGVGGALQGRAAGLENGELVGCGIAPVGDDGVAAELLGCACIVDNPLDVVIGQRAGSFVEVGRARADFERAVDAEQGGRSAFHLYEKAVLIEANFRGIIGLREQCVIASREVEGDADGSCRTCGTPYCGAGFIHELPICEDGSFVDGVVCREAFRTAFANGDGAFDEELGQDENVEGVLSAAFQIAIVVVYAHPLRVAEDVGLVFPKYGDAVRALAAEDGASAGYVPVEACATFVFRDGVLFHRLEADFGIALYLGALGDDGDVLAPGLVAGGSAARGGEFDIAFGALAPEDGYEVVVGASAVNDAALGADIPDVGSAIGGGGVGHFHAFAERPEAGDVGDEGIQYVYDKRARITAITGVAGDEREFVKTRVEVGVFGFIICGELAVAKIPDVGGGSVAVVFYGERLLGAEGDGVVDGSGRCGKGRFGLGQDAYTELIRGGAGGSGTEWPQVDDMRAIIGTVGL